MSVDSNDCLLPPTDFKVNKATADLVSGLAFGVFNVSVEKKLLGEGLKYEEESQRYVSQDDPTQEQIAVGTVVQVRIIRYLDFLHCLILQVG